MKFISLMVMFSFIILFYACKEQTSVVEQTKDADVLVETTTTSTLSL